MAASALLAFACSSWAGPVQEGSVDAGVAGGDQASAGTAAFGVPLAGHEATAPTTAAPLTPNATAEAGAASLAGAIAAEIMKETAADARRSEQSHSTQRASTRSTDPAKAAASAGQGQARPTEDAWDWRETGKAAMHWLKQGVPWLRSEADEENEAERPVNLEAIDWSRLDGAAAAGGSRTAVIQISGSGREAPRDPLSTVGYGSTAPPSTSESGLNVLRWVMDVVRPVIEHPMTWLVVSLFVIGAIVVKKIDRRPTK